MALSSCLRPEVSTFLRGFLGYFARFSGIQITVEPSTTAALGTDERVGGVGMYHNTCYKIKQTRTQ